MEQASSDGNMSDAADPCSLCREMSGELMDIVRWMADEDLSPIEFANTIAELERRKLARFGFVLSSAVSEGPIVHFSLRSAATGDFCASMDVNPHTGEFFIQRACV